MRGYLGNVVQLKYYPILAEIRDASTFALTWSRLIVGVSISAVEPSGFKPKGEEGKL